MQSNHSMKTFVSGLLKNKLSPFYFYHNPEHTLYVTEQAAAIGRAEACTAKEINLLEAAALWHDTGFITSYTNHEEESCILARQYLPEYGYSATYTAAVCGMIMATKMPQTPQNKLESILADDDLEYLGTAGAGEKAAGLFKELQHQDPSLTLSAWHDFQIAFLVKHHYFTRFCKENREWTKKEYLQRLLNGIE
jgi:uncharacterized protein